MKITDAMETGIMVGNHVTGLREVRKRGTGSVAKKRMEGLTDGGTDGWRDRLTD